MKDKFFIIVILAMLIFSIMVFVGIGISQKIEESYTSNIENVENEEESTNEIGENIIKDDISADEVPIIDKVITEVNIVSNINTLTNPKIENIAKNTFEEYFQKIASYEKSNIGPMPYLLKELELATEEELDLLCKNVSSTSEYIRTNIRYESFQNALLQYVTEEYFIKYFSQYRNIDGFVAFCDCAGSGVWIGVESAELVSRVGNTFNFKLTIKDLEMYDQYLNGDEYVKEEDCFVDIDVALEYVNNRLVVSEYNTGTILEGTYFLDNTDVSYDFYKDGTVEYSTNMVVYKGTYINCGENELKITWEEETTWDIITAEEFVSKMEGTEVVTVINNKKIRVESEHDGETVINEFIKK